jgi:hypothetical protein
MLRHEGSSGTCDKEVNEGSYLSSYSNCTKTLLSHDLGPQKKFLLDINPHYHYPNNDAGGRVLEPKEDYRKDILDGAPAKDELPPYYKLMFTQYGRDYSD